MMKKYAVAAAFAGSLLAAPAFAQDATSCTTMLTDFDAHLAANNIQATDERVTQARTEAERGSRVSSDSSPTTDPAVRTRATSATGSSITTSSRPVFTT